MKAETWLARCAAELQHLYQTDPHFRTNAALAEHWNMDAAGELIEALPYRGLDPVQAARVFWRNRASGACTG
jgi:hypothetical protein